MNTILTLSQIQRLSTLRREAQARGHNLTWGTPFRHNGGWGQTGTCNCGCYVQILTKPQANQIELGGDALALNCPN